MERPPTEHGPFDIIGDVHGCCDELEDLLERLGYDIATGRRRLALVVEPMLRHPEGRKAVFVGDLVDRGPRILDTCGSCGTWSTPARPCACPATTT